MFGNRSILRHWFLNPLISSTAFGSMMVSAAPPGWWSSNEITPVIATNTPINNHGVANVGQAKWMARNALDSLRAVVPDLADQVEADLVGVGKPIASWAAPANETERQNQRAPLKLGQLKAIAAPFYEHIHSVAPAWLAKERTVYGMPDTGTFYPWTATNTDDSNKSPATIGQLKAVFSLDFAADREVGVDSDGLSDLWQYYHFSSLTNNSSSGGNPIEGWKLGHISPQYRYPSTLGRAWDRDNDLTRDDGDADPNDPVIDWKKRSEPLFVVQPIPKGVGEWQASDVISIADMSSQGDILNRWWFDGHEHLELFDSEGGYHYSVSEPDAQNSEYHPDFETASMGFANSELQISGSRIFGMVFDKQGLIYNTGGYFDPALGTGDRLGYWAQDAEFVNGAHHNVHFEHINGDGLESTLVAGALPDWETVWGGGAMNMDMAGNVLVRSTAGDLWFWRYTGSAYDDPIEAGYIDQYSNNLSNHLISATLRQGEGSTELLRYLVLSDSGLSVGKPLDSFEESNAENFGLLYAGITQDGWIAADDYEISSIWFNGRWKLLQDCLLNGDDYVDVRIIRMEENGVAVASALREGEEDRIMVRLLPIDATSEIESKTHSVVEPVNPPYMREARLSGVQKSDVKPQQEGEIDIPDEETSVDAWSRRLRHDNSLAYVDVPASDLDLGVKISANNQPFWVPALDTLTVAAPVTSAKVSRAVEEAAAWNMGSFGLGWSTNLDAKITIRPVFEKGTPRDPQEYNESVYPLLRYDVEVRDENGSSYQFSTLNLQEFHLKPNGAADFDQYLVSLAYDELAERFVLKKKFGTSTTYKWDVQPSSLQDLNLFLDQHSLYTGGSWFQPAPFTAVIERVEDRYGNKVEYTDFDDHTGGTGTVTRTIKAVTQASPTEAMQLELKVEALSATSETNKFDLVTGVKNARGQWVNLEYEWVDCIGGQLPVLARVIQPDGSVVQYGYLNRLEPGTGYNAVLDAGAPDVPNDSSPASMQDALARRLALENDDMPQLPNIFHVNLGAVQTPGGKLTTFEWQADVRFETSFFWQEKMDTRIDPSFSTAFQTYLEDFEDDAIAYRVRRTSNKIDRQQKLRGAYRIGKGVYVARARGVADVISGVKVIDGDPTTQDLHMTIAQSRPAPQVPEPPEDEDDETPQPDPDDFGTFLESVPDLPRARTWNPTANSQVITTVTDTVGRETKYVYKDFQLLRVAAPIGGAPSPLEEQWREECDRNQGMGYGTMEFHQDVSHHVTYHFDPAANYALKESIDLNGNVTLYEHGNEIPVGSRFKWIKETFRDEAETTKAFLHFEDPTAEVRKDSSGAVLTRKEFTYDTATRVKKSMVDARGNETVWNIDSSGRTTSQKSYLGGSSGGVAALRSHKFFDYTNSNFKNFITKETQFSLNTAEDPTWVGDLVTEYVPDQYGHVWKTIVDPGGLNLVTETVYDKSGMLLSKKDPKGNETTFGYDAMGRLTTVTNPDSSTRSIGYDNDGRKIRETDENGNSTLWKYDGYGRVWKTGRDLNGNQVLDSGDPVITTTYNEIGQPLTLTDPRGSVTTNAYDTWHRLVSSTDALDGVSALDYSGENSGTGLANDAKWLPTRAVDPRGFVTATTYDDLYRPRTVSKEYTAGTGAWATRTLGASLVSETDYDANGNVTEARVKDSASSTALKTTTEYDALNRATLVTTGVGTALASSARTKYSSTGFAVEAIAFEGDSAMERHSATEYDKAGRAVKVWQPDPVTGGITANSPMTETIYDKNGNAEAVIDPLLRRTDFAYDTRNRKWRTQAPAVTNAANPDAPVTNVRPTTITAYDDASRVIAVTDPRGSITRTFYDRADRAIKVRSNPVTGNPSSDLNAPVANDITAHTVYDKGGLALSVTDGNGNITRNAYDKLGRLTATITDPVTGNPVNPSEPGFDADAYRAGSPTGILVTNAYDETGNLILVTDGKGQKTGFTYDGFARKTATIWDPGTSLAKGDSAEFNAIYQVKRTDGEGRVTLYKYDVLNRLEDVVYGPVGSATTSSHADNRHFSYDKAGKVLSVTFPNESSSLRGVVCTYDKLDRLTSETSAGVTHSYPLYDKAGNRKVTTYGRTGTTLVSTYDALNRLEECEERSNASTPSGRYTRYAYDLGSVVTRKTLPNGAATTTSRDKLGRTLAITEKDSGGAVISAFDYAQPVNGWPSSHDAAGNVLRCAETYSQAGMVNRVVSNTYDHCYRLDTETITPTGGAAAVTAYGYDLANNRTTKTIGSATTAYVFGNGANGANSNQLKSYGPSGQAATCSFTYDDNGNRETRVTAAGTDNYDWDFENRLTSLTVANGNEYTYGYDYRSRRLIRDETQAGGANVILSFSGGLSVQEADASNNVQCETIRGSDWGGGVGGILYTVRGGQRSYNAYNSRGDVVSTTDDSGAAIWQGAYEAFGTRTAEQGTNDERQRANTKEEDPTGLLNEGFRYRDLEAGVFISRDPAGFVDGPNVYTYVNQNPWTAFDPDGLFGLGESNGSALDSFWNNYVQHASAFAYDMGGDWRKWSDSASDEGNYVTAALQDTVGNFVNAIGGAMDKNVHAASVDRVVAITSFTAEDGNFTFSDGAQMVGIAAGEKFGWNDGTEAVTGASLEDGRQLSSEEQFLKGTSALGKGLSTASLLSNPLTPSGKGGALAGKGGGGGLLSRVVSGSADDIANALDGVTGQSSKIAAAIRGNDINVNIMGRWQYFKSAWKAGGADLAFNTRGFAQGNTINLKASRFNGGKIFGDAVHEGTHALDALNNHVIGRSVRGIEARAWSAEMQFQKATGAATYADSYLGLRNIIRKEYR